MSFDRLAPHYRWMEFVLAGDKLQRCRLAWLDKVRRCRKVLLVGEGPGRYLKVLARELPAARIVCVDASHAMLQRAGTAWRQAGGNPEQLELIHATLPEWRPPAATFDLIVTHFFLDCFPEGMLSQVIANLAAAAQHDARWVISDFQLPAAGMARLRARSILGLAYAFFKITTRLPAQSLISPDPLLVSHGFQLRHRRTFDWQLLRADVWAREGSVFPPRRARFHN